MPFFFFDEDLSNNVIVQEALKKICFEKLMAEGYCDMNSVFNRPQLKREEIAFELAKINSPLASLFKRIYPKTIVEAKKRLLAVLEKEALDIKQLNYYSMFAIVYYIYRTIPTYEERSQRTQGMFESWKKYLYEFTGNFLSSDLDLRISGGIIFDFNTVDLRVIRSISNYVDLLDEIRMPEKKVFFRGHSDISYRLLPSIFRKEEWLHNEKKMYQELQINCPDDFSRMKNHLETLAEMQHYGLPTRLLDITQNPLIALYFACESRDTYSGEVILFSIDKDNIKYPQSDTVALLASLPLFTNTVQRDFYFASKDKTLTLDTFNKRITRLVQEVRLERPGFKDEVLPEDLSKSVVVIPSRNNRRIDRQEGAFIICGLLEEIYGTETRNSITDLRAKDIDGKKIVCVIGSKDKIQKQMNSLGINKARIYPEIDDVADYIKNHTNEL